VNQEIKFVQYVGDMSMPVKVDFFTHAAAGLVGFDHAWFTASSLAQAKAGGSPVFGRSRRHSGLQACSFSAFPLP